MNRAGAAIGGAAPLADRMGQLDPKRTSWYDRFFDNFRFDNLQECLRAVQGISVDVDALASAHDLKRYGLSGWMYWFLYVSGYLQFSVDQKIDESNPYVKYMLHHFSRTRHDPGLDHVLASRERAEVRIRQRFEDFHSFSTSQDAKAIALGLDPVEVVVKEPPQLDSKKVYEPGSETPILAAGIDGYHRLFVARLFGCESVRCYFRTGRHRLPAVLEETGGCREGAIPVPPATGPG